MTRCRFGSGATLGKRVTMLALVQGLLAVVMGAGTTTKTGVIDKIADATAVSVPGIAGSTLTDLSSVTQLSPASAVVVSTSVEVTPSNSTSSVPTTISNVTTTASPTLTPTSAANATTSITNNATSAFSSSNAITSTATTNATSTAVTSSTPLPTGPTGPADPELETLLSRRLTFIVQQQTMPEEIATWISTLQDDGTWPDVDYTSGCPAQRANWPAENHWFRLGTLAAAWHGGFNASEQYVKSDDLRAKIGLAMDWWFARDFTEPTCLDMGGTGSCPCGTPGLWNTNWFSNVIGVSRPISQVCLLLNPTLTPTQFSNCTNIPLRSYSIFHRAVKPGFLAGANTLDTASIGISGGLLLNNMSIVKEAYGFVHNEVQVQVGFQKDGILTDGSFAQHGGLLYNGNYGKDYANDVLELEIEAGGTQYAGEGSSRAAFESLMDADQWIAYQNTKTGTLHWDFSATGRFISFPVVDGQATSSILINLTEVKALADLWPSTVLQGVYDDLTTETGTANVGGLIGNRMFWNSDYMVNRGKNYVTTVKMYSSRVHNAECTNSQNPFGFHQSDGVLYTYQNGDEYEDIAPAMDWNMFPGITVDYAATPLSCDKTNFNGVENFVGGVSTGKIGFAVMRYTNPLTKAFSFQKSWFFFPGDIQHVSVSILNSTSSAPVFSILDQRKRNGPISIDFDSYPPQDPTGNYTFPHTLFHDHIGYVFSPWVSKMSIATGPRTGNWSSLGISTQPPPTIDLFSAWLVHEDLNTPLSYSIFPGRSAPSAFLAEAISSPIQTIQEDTSITAVQDVQNAVAMVVFWQPYGGTVAIPPAWRAGLLNTIHVQSDNALIMILEERTWTITVADPTQTLSNATLVFDAGFLLPIGWGRDRRKVVYVNFPSGGKAGSSVVIPLLD